MDNRIRHFEKGRLEKAFPFEALRDFDTAAEMGAIKEYAPRWWSSPAELCDDEN